MVFVLVVIVKVRVRQYIMSMNVLATIERQKYN